MRVGILAPYRRCEAGFAACDLASVFRLGGHAVSVGSSCRPGRVHAAWDGSVRSVAGALACRDWVCGLDALVFVGLPSAHQWASVTPRRLFTALVPTWNDMHPDLGPAYSRFDRVVSPHPTLNQVFEEGYALDGPAYSAIPWSPGGPAPATAGVGAGRRMVVVCDSPGLDGDPVGIADACAILLERHRCLSITVLCPSPGSRPGGRLAALGVRVLDVPADRWPAVIAGHDLAVYPAIQADFARGAWVAAACGVPVLGFGLPPFSDACVATGYAIPCDVLIDEAGRMAAGDVSPGLAVVAADAWLAGGRPRSPEAVASAAVAVADRRAAFVRDWLAVLPVPAVV